MEKYKWLNKHSRIFLERGYLEDGLTPEGRIRQIAETAEKYLGIIGFADKFEDYMSMGFYSLSTPVWTNFGNNRGLPVSCFNSHVPDTMQGILEKASEVGMMSKFGGGTSGFFGELRPRGSKISVGGESGGPNQFFPFVDKSAELGIKEFLNDGGRIQQVLELFDLDADTVSQGSTRRGSFAAYLPIEHPDIEEFLLIRSEGHPIQNMSIGVCISDEWMQSMIDGDRKKRELWLSVVKKRSETGYPYIFFTDTVNDSAPPCYKNNKIKINASNLCVTGDQRVVSNHGILTTRELWEMGCNLELFDNSKIVKASPMRLIEKNADVYEITLDNGMTHTVTGYHKLCVFDKNIQKKKSKQVTITKDVECKDLKIGDLVSIQTNKGLFGGGNLPHEAFLLGLYQGDGTQYKDQIHICLWQNDFDLLDEVQKCHDYICDKYNTQHSKSNNRKYPNPKFSDAYVEFSSVKKKVLSSNALKKALNFEKGYVPEWIWSADEETHWQYIRGLYYSDGTVFMSQSKGNPIQISLANINREFLREVQIILSNLGLQSSIRLLRNEGPSILPDGKGGSKEYISKTCWRLIIGNKNDAITFDENTSFLERKGIILERRKYRDNTKKFYSVSQIKHAGKQDVFCCSVDSKEHHWICNGIVTHNCSEITLQSDADNSFVCVLSSLNLVHWDEIVKTDAIETLIQFLDAVNEEFIIKTDGVSFMQSARNFAITQRALGAGVLGWHSLLQSKMIPFESMEAKLLNSQIWRTIRERADAATEYLAGILGEPELLKKYGRRNVTTLAVAPTTSSSFILGQVSPSIEPENSCYYVKKLAKGSFTYQNPYLRKLLKSYGKDTDEIWKSILLRGGSVQHLDFLSDNEKDVFKTFGEIPQKEIVIQAAQRQKYIDQSQSLNLMIPPEAKLKEVSNLLIEGWRLKVKTFYYQRSANPVQQLSRSIMTCTSCEA